METQINVHPNVRVDYQPADTTKQVRITANSLLAGTVLPVFNSRRNALLTSSSNPNFINFQGSDGGIGFAVFLPIQFDSNSGVCTVGSNASNNPSEPGNAAASLTITFSDTIPGAAVPVNINNAAEFWSEKLPTTHYQDLKLLANGKRYCQVRVNPMANSHIAALLEGQVYIHLIQNAASTSPCVIYAIENTRLGPSSGNGEPFWSVQNANVYFDLNAGSYLYLVAMIGKKGNNPWTFEVGDPKADAGVGASEV